VTDSLQLESVGIEPVRRETVLAVLGELTRLIEDDGLPCACPLVCCSDDRSAFYEEGEVMKAGLVA
jgi:hypothetical protein